MTYESSQATHPKYTPLGICQMAGVMASTAASPARSKHSPRRMRQCCGSRLAIGSCSSRVARQRSCPFELSKAERGRT